jgi:alpha-glucoside transport system permease protein
VWNDYLVGYVFAGGNNAPLTVRLVDLAGSRGEDWQRLTAAAFITMVVPLAVFASLQRFFVRGLVTGAVKG